MFGIFKKKNYTKELLTLVFAQNNILEKLVAFLPLLAEDAFEKSRQKESEMFLEWICGLWICEKIGITVKIRKEKSGYFVSIADVGGLDHDFKVSFAIRTYKGMSYFIIDSYAVFIEYDKITNTLNLDGSLRLILKFADESIYPGKQFDFNPN